MAQRQLVVGTVNQVVVPSGEGSLNCFDFYQFLKGRCKNEIPREIRLYGSSDLPHRDGSLLLPGPSIIRVRSRTERCKI